MIKVICPNNNIPERTYAIDFVFNSLLGLEKLESLDTAYCSVENVYYIEYSQAELTYIIQKENTELIVHDHFWNKYQDPLSYLKIENLPNKLAYLHALNFEIPIVYGEDLFVQNENTTIIGLDIFASIFFMLTRWEEILLGREENGDCNENELWTVKNDIHKRPIVHEYELLLRHLLFNGNTTIRNYQVIMTHDVDGIITPSFLNVVKTGICDKIYGRPKNKIVNLSWRQKLHYRKVFPRATSQFNLYTTLCSEYDVPEWFFMKVCKSGEVESTYPYNSRQTGEVMTYLRQKFQQPVKIGFHPSQTTFNNDTQWVVESERIKNLLKERPPIGRNHHLLYNNGTYQRWNQLLSNSESYVSNCVFHKHIGFRSGVAVPYAIFDVHKRQQLRICEIPCQIMDSALRLHKYVSIEDMMKDIIAIVDDVRKYSGTLLLTWHIYIRDINLLMEYFEICKKTVKYAAG